MREPGDLLSLPGDRIPAAVAVQAIRSALRGPADDTWHPPLWLLPHQHDAARRLAGALTCFTGALLADAVGLGKTYVGLAIATRYPRTCMAVPAALRRQWTAAMSATGVRGSIVTHEALSHGGSVPGADLIVVDEAHRFRNPATKRYDRLARGVRQAHVLLLTATPVVNRVADLVHLLRLFLADHALGAFGVRSLTGAEAGNPDDLLGAVLPLVVARSARAARITDSVPAARACAVHRLPPVPHATLRDAVAALRRLRFPPLGRTGRMLLFRHLLLRLSSSREAVEQSLRRHQRYVERAREACLHGEAIDRGILRRLILDDAPDQLCLLFANGAATPPAIDQLAAEADRLRKAEAVLGRCDTDPKRLALVAELDARRPRKTIVFTAARATALAIARSLGWRHVGVATATGGQIASGRVPLDELLARFAPDAQHGGPVPAAMRVDVLVATDLASEGLNLQDADAVVHYDLPWNPLRLSQRLGRIARLGSRHSAVHVSWYQPPPVLERALGLLATIHRKAALQLALPVPVTGVVGRAAVTSARLERREVLAARGTGGARGHAVVDGRGGCLVLRWDGPRGTVREAVMLDGSPTLLNADALLQAAERSGRPAAVMLVAARRLLVSRCAAAQAGPAHAAAHALGRRLLGVARAAGRRRDRRLVSALDAALDRLRDGVAVGAERELTFILGRPTRAALEAWAQSHPVRHPGFRAAVAETLLVGAPAEGARPRRGVARYE